MEDLTGKQLGQYQVVAAHGEGGMAAVYKAYQPGMERYVALKILPRFYASDPEFVGRFKQEAKVIARLQHVHILPVFDFGEEDGYTYIVMPFIQTGTLADLLRGEALELTRIREVISQVGSALGYAHGRGLIHRDIKPSNILIDDMGNSLLTDFGIAKIVEGTVQFTQSGAILGTPAYMSPEQILGDELDGRTDIYSLGVVLFEMATGRPPFHAETPPAIFVKHLHDPLPLPSSLNPALPEPVERVILKALAKGPDKRYASADEMVQGLREAIPEPISMGKPQQEVEEAEPETWVEELQEQPQPSTPTTDSKVGDVVSEAFSGADHVELTGESLLPREDDGEVEKPIPASRARNRQRLLRAGMVVGGLTALGVVIALVGGGAVTRPAPDAPDRSATDQIMTDATRQVEPAQVGETAALAEDQTLIVAQSADAGTLDPALETSANSLAPASHIYEGLTGFEPGTTNPVPALAVSWDATADGLEWTFNLRDGVKFHDGTDFDADAVVFNFERWWDTDNPYNLGADQFIYWDYMFQGFKGNDTSVLAGVEAVDSSTVKLMLNVPNASLLNTLTMENFRFASPTAIEEQGDTYGTAEGQAVGTGPFMVDEWVKEDHLTLARFDDYWGEAPTLDKIIYRVIPDTSAAFLALQAGEIDALSMWASPSPDDINAAMDDPNLQVVYNPGLNVGYLGLNHGKAWLQNINTRLAIAHAIDKQAIIDAMYPGDAVPASQFVPESLWGYNDSIVDYPYDVAAAQDFLQAAVDEGVEIPDPAIFYVMPVSRAYYPDPQAIGELIQAQLAEIGINTEIQSPAWPDPYLSDLEEDGTKHDLFMLGWVGDNGDPDNFLCPFFCGGDTAFNNNGAGGGLPPDEEIADLLRSAVAETDFETRKAMYEEINQMIFDRVIGMPVVTRTPPTLLRADVGGYVPSPVREMLAYLSKYR
jgi:peptide/nickel transport system substrate-binding protein